MCERDFEETSTSASTREAQDAEAVDVAIADALRAQKNRGTGDILFGATTGPMHMCFKADRSYFAFCFLRQAFSCSREVRGGRYKFFVKR